MENKKDNKSVLVKDLGLSTGATNALLQGGIETLQQLIDVVNKGNLMKYRNVGKTKYLEIMNKIYQINHQPDIIDAINDETVLREMHADISKKISNYRNTIAALEMEKKICEKQIQQLRKNKLNVTKK